MTQLTLFDPVEIPLTRGYIALVDPVDCDLAAYRWRSLISPRGVVYAVRSVSVNGRPTTVLMHRLILERILGRPLSRSEETDHWDRDGLNNCRGNLRLATTSQNQRNRGVQSNNTSGYKGVSWHAASRRWEARIKLNGATKHLGLFDDPIAGHEAYCAAAAKYHGEFARTE